jgi:hypothetical protein
MVNHDDDIHCDLCGFTYNANIMYAHICRVKCKVCGERRKVTSFALTKEYVCKGCVNWYYQFHQVGVENELRIRNNQSQGNPPLFES